MSDFVAGVFSATGKPYFSTSGHPAMLAHRMRSPSWELKRRPGIVSAPGATAGETVGMQNTVSSGRMTAGFEYIGPKYDWAAKELGLKVA